MRREVWEDMYIYEETWKEGYTKRREKRDIRRYIDMKRYEKICIWEEIWEERYEKRDMKRYVYIWRDMKRYVYIWRDMKRGILEDIYI